MTVIPFARQWMRGLTQQPPFPLVIQSDESECGLACLAMVLSAADCPLGLENLRRSYGSTRGGMTIQQLCDLSAMKGLRAIPSRGRVTATTTLPCILYVRDEHFSVLWRVSNERFWIADPADGLLILNRQEFDTYFADILITMRPMKPVLDHAVLEAKRQDQAPASIFDSVPREGSFLLILLALAAVISIFSLANAGFQDIFMTYVVEEGNIYWSKGIAIATITVAVMMAVSSLCLQILVLRQLQSTILIWNKRLFGSLFNAPYSFFISKTSGLIVSRLNQVDEALQGFQGCLLSAVMGCLNLAIYLVAVVLVSPPLALLSLLAMAGFGAVGLRFYGLNLQNNYFYREGQCRSSSAEFKLISGREQLVLEGCDQAMQQDLAGGYLSQGQAELRLETTAAVNELFVGVVDQLLNGLLLAISGFLIIRGELTTGSYTAINVLIGTAMQPIRSVAGIIETIQNSAAAFNKANELFHPEVAIKTKDATRSDSVLACRDLSFSYSLYSEPVFDHVNLTLKARGEKPILVRLDGDTGSGKTTFVNLILGLLEPSAGDIQIDGQPLHSLSRKERHGLVQLVDRNPLIVGGSIKRNCFLARPYDATLFSKTLRSLGLHEQSLFRDQSDRYLTDATSLSTGQGVMIALLRAALLQPKLLVLDEALTSLPEALHSPVLVGLRNLGLHVLIIQHGVSSALTSIPTLTMAQLKRQTSDAS